MKTISVIARIFLVIFVFIYGVVNVGGQMAMANAAGLPLPRQEPRAVTNFIR